MAARRASAKCASVLLVLVVMVSGSASARIALPTSDYNALDTSAHASEQQVDAPALQSAAADASGAGDGEPSVGEDAGSLLPWTVGAVRMLRRLYLECRDDDLSSCLKVHMVRAMDRVARSTRKVALAAGVTLERDADAPDQPADPQVADDLEHTLPRSLPERERSLDKLILERLYGFLQNYSLRFKLPSVAELGGAVGEDARRRRPPLNGLMGLGMLLAGSLLPMKFGMLAMLAGKALMLSKLALLISALMAMRNMGSGGAPPEAPPTTDDGQR